MKNFRIISRLEVKSEYVIKGIRMEGLRKISNPTSIVKNFKNKFIDEIFYEDVVASLYNRVNLKIIKSVSNLINIPFSVSGRVRTLKDYYTLFNNGADKVSVNTASFENPRLYIRPQKFLVAKVCVRNFNIKNYIEKKKLQRCLLKQGERENLLTFMIGLK